MSWFMQLQAGCKHRGSDTDTVAWRSNDGTKIEPHQTVEELGLEDGDSIDAMIAQ